MKKEQETQKTTEERLTERNSQRDSHYEKEFACKHDYTCELNEIWSSRRKTSFRSWISEKELSEYLARLEIIGMRLTRNDLSDHAIVATGLNCQKIVLTDFFRANELYCWPDSTSHSHEAVTNPSASAHIDDVRERPFSSSIYYYEWQSFPELKSQ